MLRIGVHRVQTPRFDELTSWAVVRRKIEARGGP
jgi:hypothetical protein